MIHNLELIADLYSRSHSANEIKCPLKNRGQRISLFSLTLSDISAEIAVLHVNGHTENIV
jgi:hypothetical protein